MVTETSLRNHAACKMIFNVVKENTHTHTQFVGLGAGYFIYKDMFFFMHQVAPNLF